MNKICGKLTKTINKKKREPQKESNCRCLSIDVKMWLTLHVKVCQQICQTNRKYTFESSYIVLYDSLYTGVLCSIKSFLKSTKTQELYRKC